MAAKVMLSPKITVNIVNFLVKGVLNRRLRLSGLTTYTNRAYCTKDTEESNDYEVTSDDEPVDLDQLRDISRLPRLAHAKMDHVSDVEFVMEPRQSFQEGIRFKRRTYAQFGRASGLDPGLAWPSKEEMADIIADEAEWEPTLQERMRLMKQSNEAERVEKQDREAMIDKQMAKMPEYLDQFRANRGKERELDRRGEAKRRALVEEARDYFGFHVDPRDLRLREMQERRAAEEIELKKKKKKGDKEAKIMGKLQAMAAKSRDESAKKSGEDKPQKAAATS